ncbi:hypothetical protein [Ammoniphilus sp. 3BR4]|uniref:hypothetical protein n=1 Tax=Ammoniphilus sp. 3BR4 TaxID=3158265 RepID=UPI00346653C8
MEPAHKERQMRFVIVHRGRCQSQTGFLVIQKVQPGFDVPFYHGTYPFMTIPILKKIDEALQLQDDFFLGIRRPVPPDLRFHKPVFPNGKTVLFRIISRNYLP